MTNGDIITIGGNLELYPEEAILVRFIEKAEELTDGIPCIAVIPSASANPSIMASTHSSLFESMGAETLILDPEDRVEANSDDIQKRADSADAYFFTGGHQLRITALLGGTELVDTIHKNFRDGALLTGTSAGSVCMTELMISQDRFQRPFVHGEVELTQGLGFIDDFIIDTHFSTRGRFSRLIHIVSESPGSIGIGLGENTAAIWDLEEEKFSVLGDGNVIVIDGKHIVENNAPDVGMGETISVSGIRVHVLGDGAGYNYEECRMDPPER